MPVGHTDHAIIIILGRERHDVRLPIRLWFLTKNDSHYQDWGRLPTSFEFASTDPGTVTYLVLVGSGSKFLFVRQGIPMVYIKV